MPNRLSFRIAKAVLLPVAIAALFSGLAGCSTGALTDALTTTPTLPKISMPSVEDLTPFSSVKTAPVAEERKLTPADYMGADGSCPPPAADTPPPGVTLGMPECDLIHSLGAPEHVEVGSDERGRSVVAIYSQGARPGLYRFSDGRLRSIEAAAQPQPKAKRAPVRKKTTTKKKAKPAQG
jgi:hypothetical protein